MRLAAALVAGCILAGCTAQAPPPQTQTGPNLAPEAIADIADTAYVYGLPYVEMARTRADLLSLVPGADHFTHRRGLATAASRRVTTPNNDTLYSTAWLDLACGPVLLRTPDFGTHYWSVALMGMNTDNFAIPGSRSHGNRPGRFLIAGADWRGEVPEGTELIRSPSRWVWALARIGSDDLAAATRLQDGLSLTAPATGCPASARLQAPAAAPAEFLRLLSDLLAENPPPAADAPVLAQLARIGLLPGRSFSSDGWSAPARDALQRGFERARQRVLRSGGLSGPAAINGWSFPPADIGDFGTDYALRAVVALHGLAALPPAEAVYATYVGDGTAITGAKRWRLHFAADALPPVDGFWSLTLYEPTPDGRFYFFANPESRYSIGDRTQELTRNADGSLDILIQADQPARLAANWLPAPAGRFALNFRAYLPQKPLLDGSWHIPPLGEAR